MTSSSSYGDEVVRTPFEPGATSLIVEVPVVEVVVGPLRRRHDPVAPSGMPAHVTLLWPFMNSERIDDGILAELRAFFAGQPAFDFELARLDEFPGVLYLAPEPSEPFIALTRELWRRHPEHPPFAGIYENIVPHLTIAHSEDRELLAAIREEVEMELGMCKSIRCRADSVALMAERDGNWTKREDFPLSGGEPNPL